MTNDLLKKNAEMLKMGTVETAREAERSVVDIQTLQHTNEQLISTLDEVMKIQTEQIGNVVIEDNVEIGANVCIDRATMGATLALWIFSFVPDAAKIFSGLLVE